MHWGKEVEILSWALENASRQMWEEEKQQRQVKKHSHKVKLMITIA